ncbi:DUF6653 family protein [Maridesulfovibrio zosterae]|uniref:DUF6653 family protein n=1 Tax=Maridesulfovibrio zosterae TaxID=82171 RepID=UPI00048854A8|nr:DUF6653 family protein [Maridesulfovibrio zosterae]
MTLERKIAFFFKLDDENWMKHANPISVWTRYSVLPIIVISFWSRVWIGWWCVVPGAFSILWMFFNPILFNKPKSTKSWASKAVLGERVFLNRDRIQIPEKHRTPLHGILNTISSVGMALTIWATIYYSIWGVTLGVFLAYIGKSWFLDRMVWLYEDMKNNNDVYKSWDY